MKKDYRIAVISEYGEFRRLREDWNRLARKQPAYYPFLCFEWFDIWFTAFLGKARLHIYVLRENSAVRAILPLIRSRIMGRWTIRLAVNEHSHKIDLLSDGEDLEGYVWELTGMLLNEKASLVYLEDLLAEAESVRHILRVARWASKSHLCETRYVRESVFVDTTEGWEKIRNGLSRKFRNNIRRQMNRLQKLGELRFAEFRGQEDLEAAYQCIKEISANSWQGSMGTGLFCRKDTEYFYTKLGEFSSRMGWLVIWVMHLGGKPLAYEYHINNGKVVYPLKAEYNMEYSHLAPGAVLDAHLLRVVSNGPTEKYDLLGFDEDYKKRWSDEREKYVRIYLYRKNLLGILLHFIEFPLRARLKRYQALRKLKGMFSGRKTRAALQSAKQGDAH